MKSLAAACLFAAVLACSRQPAATTNEPAPAAPPAPSATPASSSLPAGPFNPVAATAALERALLAARTHDDPTRYQQLLADAADVAARAPTLARPRQIHTVALLALGRAREALPAARALATEAPDVVSFGLLADAALATGDLDGAAAATTLMMDAAPGLPVYARVAELRFRTGDVDGSLEMWRTAFQAGHKSVPEAMAYTAVGAGDVFLFGKGDVEQAARSYDVALAALPHDAAALYGKARARLAAGQPCDVDAVEAAARDADVVAVAADCAARAGAPVDTEGFVARVEEVAARDPRSAALALATRNVALGRARELADRQAQDAGGLEDADALAFVLMRQGDIDGALPHAKRALSSGTADVRVQARMGLVMARADDATIASEARALLKKLAAAPGVEPLLREEIRVTLLP